MRNNAGQILSLLWLTAALGTQAVALPGTDEGSCIHALATAKANSSSWRHLNLERLVYFSGPARATRTYTIYATLARNTPRMYKVQFRAEWTVGSSGGHCLIAGTPFSVTNSAGELVLQWRNPAEGVTTELNPLRFPLNPNAPATEVPVGGFYAERDFTQPPGGRIVQGMLRLPQSYRDTFYSGSNR